MVAEGRADAGAVEKDQLMDEDGKETTTGDFLAT
jgi:hypothetical protein